MNPIKEIKITYPDIFTESLLGQLTYYADHKTNRLQKKLFKKLIENQDMQTEVFPALLQIKNITIPDTIPTPNVESISMFLHYCIQIYEHSTQIKPLSEKAYQNLYGQISKDIKRLIKNVTRLKEVGAYYVSSIRNSLIDQLSSIDELAKSACANPPIYSHGNLGMTRKLKNYQYHYFITRLSLYTENLFKRPLHNVIGITANVVFDLDNSFDENNVKKKIFEFKKEIGCKGYDSENSLPES